MRNGICLGSGCTDWYQTHTKTVHIRQTNKQRWSDEGTEKGVQTVQRNPSTERQKVRLQTLEGIIKGQELSEDEQSTILGNIECRIIK